MLAKQYKGFLRVATFASAVATFVRGFFVFWVAFLVWGLNLVAGCDFFWALAAAPSKQGAELGFWSFSSFRKFFVSDGVLRDVA